MKLTLDSLAEVLYKTRMRRLGIGAEEFEKLQESYRDSYKDEVREILRELKKYDQIHSEIEGF